MTREQVTKIFSIIRERQAARRKARGDEDEVTPGAVPGAPSNPPVEMTIRLKTGIRLEGSALMPSGTDDFVEMTVTAIDLAHLSGKPPRVLWIAIDAIEAFEIG